MTTNQRVNPKLTANHKARIVLVLLILVLFLGGCTILPSPMPQTPTPVETTTAIPVILSNVEQSTIYSWWISGSKNELWQIKANGNSSILYSFPMSVSLGEALKGELITDYGADVIQRIANNHLDGTDKDIFVHRLPASLRLSPNKQRLAWEEHIQYCPPPLYDFVVCHGELRIQVLDLATDRIETSVNISDTYLGLSYIPLWAPDSQHIAFLTQAPNSKATVTILDLETTSLTKAGAGFEFSWSPDSQNLIFEGSDGIQSFNLASRQTTVILPIKGDIQDLAMAPDGNMIVYTEYQQSQGDYNSMFIFDLRTGKVRPLLEKNDGRWLENVQWLPDSQHVVYIQQKSYTDPYHIYIRDVITGKIVLDKAFPLEQYSDGQLSYDGEEMLFVGYNNSGTTMTLMVFDFGAEKWEFLTSPVEVQKTMREILAEYKTWNNRYFWRYPAW